jgi:hypothetical protein
MKIEMTGQELELVLRALREQASHRTTHGLSADQAEALAVKLPPEIKKAVEEDMADTWKEYDEFKKSRIDTGKITSGDRFGTREILKANYLARFTGALLGIYGNSKAEAVYPIYPVDADGEKLDASRSRYTLRFAKDPFPPANAFWSLTMYELPSSLLVAKATGPVPRLPRLGSACPLGRDQVLHHALHQDRAHRPRRGKGLGELDGRRLQASHDGHDQVLRCLRDRRRENLACCGLSVR